ncbi:Annexin A8 [Chelonia mydas]|uniref:Annexin n=1 Tax=Chelonia mydas TaxID=8469 RepID=M7AQZ6_CHEMY|nr:Annexin A8 [Chelonia mydas]
MHSCLFLQRDEDGSSVKGALSFDPTPDAQVLYKAMKGLGTDEQAIIDVLTKRRSAQRQQIARSFKEQFGQDLIASLKSELSGKFERLIIALMYPPFKYDSKELHDALKGLGTSEGVIIEILASRTKVQIKEIIKAYKEVFDEYQKLASKSLEDSIQSETHGSLEDAMLAIVKCTKNIHSYFAERLYHALKGAGTCDGTLIRIIVSRSEIDLNLVKAEFLKIAGKSLSTMILVSSSFVVMNH